MNPQHWSLYSLFSIAAKCIKTVKDKTSNPEKVKKKTIKHGQQQLQTTHTITNTRQHNETVRLNEPSAAFERRQQILEEELSAALEQWLHIVPFTQSEGESV